MSCSRPFPSPDDGLRLHQRLLALDAAVTSDICAAYLLPLCESLAGRFPRVDEHLRLSAAQDALIDYLRHPQCYDPGRGDLGKFLRLAAARDLLNALRTEKRHHRGRVAWNVVEKGEESGNLQGRDGEPPLRLVRAEEEAGAARVVAAVEAGCTPQERVVLRLLLAGERDTRAYVIALGLEDRPVLEQEREVKRLKDRVKKRLQRGGESHAC